VHAIQRHRYTVIGLMENKDRKQSMSLTWIVLLSSRRSKFHWI